MDPDQRIVVFEDIVAQFFDNREDALWLFDALRSKVKEEYPNLRLTQREREQEEGEEGETSARVTNHIAKVEGNIWRIIRVSIILLLLISSQETAAEMGDVAEAMIGQVDAACSGVDKLDVEWVKKIISLVRFLRTPNATSECIEKIKYWRTYNLCTIFIPVDELEDDDEMALKLAVRHVSLSDVDVQVKVTRRLNCVRLWEALQKVDKAWPPLLPTH